MKTVEHLSVVATRRSAVTLSEAGQGVKGLLKAESKGPEK